MTSIDIPGLIKEAASDNEFQALLTSQERSLLQNWRNNPNNIGGYMDYAANVAAKYIGWQFQRDTKLGTLRKKVEELSAQVATSRDDLASISKIAKFASGATALVAYSEIFSKRAVFHERQAESGRTWYLISLIALLMVVWIVFFLNVAEYQVFKTYLAQDMQLPLSIGVFALKAIVLVFFFQVSQFFRKTYNAEMHLAEVSRHRSDVLQSLHAVYLAIDDKAEKDKVLGAGALLAFEPGETGYITTKEGAGSIDSLIEGVLGRVLK